MKLPQLVSVYFFVALGVWPASKKSCILCVEHMYKKATACSRKEEKQAELRTRSWWLEQRGGESDIVGIYSKIQNFHQICIEKYDA
jgi:hypothetical protein